MKPKKQNERRTKSVASPAGTMDLQGQILNYDRANALPSAAREHEHFYLLLFRNLIKQIILMLVFCTIVESPVHSAVAPLFCYV
jgi:hypothetical protein